MAKSSVGSGCSALGFSARGCNLSGLLGDFLCCICVWASGLGNVSNAREECYAAST